MNKKHGVSVKIGGMDPNLGGDGRENSPQRGEGASWIHL